MDKVRLIWKCSICDDVIISYSHLRHDMNICECGESGVDLEQSYQRCVGKVEEISRKILIKNKWQKIK